MAASEWLSQLNIEGFSFYREAIGELVAQSAETGLIPVKGVSPEDLDEALVYCDQQVDRLQDGLQPDEPPKQIMRLFKAIEEQRRLAAMAEYQN